MSFAKRLTINSISNVLSTVISLVLGLLLAPYMLSHLGHEVYGIWSLTGSLLAYSQMLNLGLNSAVTRWVPKLLVEEDAVGLNRVVNTALLAYLVSGVLVIVGTLVVAHGFPVWFDVRDDLVAPSQLAVLLTGVGFLFLIVLNVFSGLLGGIQRFDLVSTAVVISDLGRMIGIVIAFMNGLGLVALAAITAATHVVRNLLKTFFAMKYCSALRVDLTLADRKTFTMMAGFGLNTMLYLSGSTIQVASAKVVIGAAMGPSFVTAYAMPAIVVMMMRLLVSQISAVVQPAVADLVARARSEELNALYLASTKFALMVALPIVFFILVYSHELMSVWLGESYLPDMARVLPIMAVGGAVSLWQLPGFFVVSALGKHRFFGFVTFVSAIGSAVVAAVVAFVFDFGLEGIVTTYVVPEILIMTFVIRPYVGRVIGVSALQDIRLSLLPALASMLPYVAILAAIRTRWIPETLLDLGIGVGLLCVPIGLGWWFIGLSRVERRRFMGMLWKARS
jgi:O-antigen/teichoic acid export membrane protein